jgi:hypothetical protein
VLHVKFVVMGFWWRTIILVMYHKIMYWCGMDLVCENFVVHILMVHCHLWAMKLMCDKFMPLGTGFVPGLCGVSKSHDLVLKVAIIELESCMIQPSLKTSCCQYAYTALSYGHYYEMFLQTAHSIGGCVKLHLNW